MVGRPESAKFTRSLIGLTWHDANSSVLVEGPEIVICPGWHPSCGDGWFPMSRDTIITGLTSPHADRLACVTCGLITSWQPCRTYRWCAGR
jgi:hypothetical protein